jgi:putative CocE/NonD family hydrolase
MAPGFAAASYYMQVAYTGGASLLSHNLDWVNPRAIAKLERERPETADQVTILDQAQEAMPQLYWDLPVTPFEPHQQVDVDVQWLRDWHTNETYGDYWAVQDATRFYDRIDVPVLNYGGWYDIFGQGTIWNFYGVRQAGSGGAGDSELVMGPYTHGDIQQAQGQVMGEGFTFPENVVFSEHDLLLNWFRRHLTDEGGTESRSAARLYVPGLDEWVGVSEFPPSAAEMTTYYLHSDGGANVSEISTTNLVYDGRLSTEPPQGEEPTDEYTYDPADPVVEAVYPAAVRTDEPPRRYSFPLSRSVLSYLQLIFSFSRLLVELPLACYCLHLHFWTYVPLTLLYSFNEILLIAHYFYISSLPRSLVLHLPSRPLPAARNLPLLVAPRPAVYPGQ